MAVTSAQKSVTTSATLLTATTAPSNFGASILATNRHATVSVYLGPAGVTSSGYELKAGESVATDLSPGEALYAIAASGTVTVHVLQTGV